jgi:alkaline phosphatase D
MPAPFCRRVRTRRIGLSHREFLRRVALSSGAFATVPFLHGCGASAAAVAVPEPELPPPAQEPGPFPNPFLHGVASGDPLPDRVIFWTRVTVPVGAAGIPVRLQVYRDPQLSERVATATAQATAERDYTVKIDQDGLAPATTYYYQFEARGHRSVVGRTRTAPAGMVERLRVGVVSCSSLAHGLFNAYRTLAARTDLDVVLHLGDYIYEYGNGEYGSFREYDPPTEIITLADYRTRYAQYRSDPDLQEAHRQHPWIVVWDDHESTNNSYRDGAENHTEGVEGEWPLRKAFSQRVYDEWMPIRYPEPGNLNRIWRHYAYGDLAEFVMLDTRLFDRDLQGSIASNDDLRDPDRKMLGPEQLSFLHTRLQSSPVRWKVVGQQVMFGQFKLAGAPEAAGGGVYFNSDQWDGYQAERLGLLDFIRDNAVHNAVILTGDIHSSWAMDLTPDPNDPARYNPLTGEGSRAVEFVCPSVTSPGFEQVPGFSNADESVLVPNPHLKYFDGTRRGYLLLDITPERLQGEWYYVDTVSEPSTTERFGAAWKVDDGAARVVRGTPSEAAAGAPLAP